MAADRFRGHCQSKFYTGLFGLAEAPTLIVFAYKSPTRSLQFDAKNGLYSFALTVPEPPFAVAQGVAGRAGGARLDRGRAFARYARAIGLSRRFSRR